MGIDFVPFLFIFTLIQKKRQSKHLVKDHSESIHYSLLLWWSRRLLERVEEVTPSVRVLLQLTVVKVCHFIILTLVFGWLYVCEILHQWFLVVSCDHYFITSPFGWFVPFYGGDMFHLVFTPVGQGNLLLIS